MATTITVIPESVQSSMATPSASQAISGGAPRDFTVNILSSDWKTIGDGVHELDVQLQRSLDSGATWEQLSYAHILSGAVKGGGLPGFAVSWDGLAALVRIGHILTTVSGVARYTYDTSTQVITDHGGADQTFSWGLSVTF
jgi:hypothetical protein